MIEMLLMYVSSVCLALLLILTGMLELQNRKFEKKMRETKSDESR